jgi:PadR family transcriptional regulator, regulatory protein AphA
MARRTSSSMEVLLGLLTIAPMSGYDLGQLIRDSIHHFWNESFGQIYPNLKQLAAGGFITGKIEKQKGRSTRSRKRAASAWGSGWEWNRSPKSRAMSCC